MLADRATVWLQSIPDDYDGNAVQAALNLGPALLEQCTHERGLQLHVCVVTIVGFVVFSSI